MPLALVTGAARATSIAAGIVPRLVGCPPRVVWSSPFLVSPEGRWISGQLLHTDGGFSARF